MPENNVLGPDLKKKKITNKLLFWLEGPFWSIVCRPFKFLQVQVPHAATDGAFPHKDAHFSPFPADEFHPYDDYPFVSVDKARGQKHVFILGAVPVADL